MSDDAPARMNYDDLELDDELALLDGVPFTGIVYSLHPDGSLEQEGLYRDGLPDGLQQEWFRNGAIAWRWIAVRGNGVSENRSWYPNGGLRSTARYVDRRCIEAHAWDEDGNPIDPATLPKDNAFGQSVEGWK